MLDYFSSVNMIPTTKPVGNKLSANHHPNSIFIVPSILLVIIVAVGRQFVRLQGTLP